MKNDLYVKYLSGIFIMLIVTLFLGCNQEPTYKENVYRHLNEAFTDTLSYPTNGKHTINMEITVSGKINGEAELSIEYGAGRCNTLKLRGNINEAYETEWYNNKCIVKYTPLTKIQGDSLVVRYRFNTL